MKDETGIGWGILLVALVVGMLCFYVGEAVGKKEGFTEGFDKGYATALEVNGIED